MPVLSMHHALDRARTFGLPDAAPCPSLHLLLRLASENSVVDPSVKVWGKAAVVSAVVESMKSAQAAADQPRFDSVFVYDGPAAARASAGVPHLQTFILLVCPHLLHSPLTVLF